MFTKDSVFLVSLLSLSEDKMKKLKIKKEIKLAIKDSLQNFFRGKEVKVVHPLDLIFPKERRIRSLIGGLETSLGTRVWEPIAKTLAKNNDYTVLDEKEFNDSIGKIPKVLMHKLSDFKNKKLENENLLCSSYFKDINDFISSKNISADGYSKIPKGEGVDIWLRKGNKEYFIDIKTTQLNSGGGPKFLENILKWYTYKALSNSETDLQCFLGFPFNPHKDKDFWKKEGGKISPLQKNEEAFVADDFWNLLSGFDNTTEFIFDIFRELGEEDFGEQFQEIFNIPK